MDQDEGTTMRFRIMSIPTPILLRDGRCVARLDGTVVARTPVRWLLTLEILSNSRPESFRSPGQSNH